MSITVKQAIKTAVEILVDQSQLLDTQLLLAKAMNKDRTFICLNQEMIVSKEEYETFMDDISKKRLHIPTAYILGHKEFWDYSFAVDQNVLIPRCDTETLIEATLKLYDTNTKLDILELGVGSGAIIITLLKIYQNALAVAVDISKEALAVCNKNAIQLNCQERLKLLQSDWFNNIDASNQFDIIISNPPYIDPSHHLSKDVLHEPSTALFAEDKGLINYKIIAKQAASFLKANGKVVLEVGYDQAIDVKEIFFSQGYYLYFSVCDLANIERCLIFSKS